jgi:hypothetical protein
VKHFRVTFHFTRIVESDDADAVQRCAYHVGLKIGDAIKPLGLPSVTDIPGVQVLGPDYSERGTGVTVEDMGDVE